MNKEKGRRTVVRNH